MQRAKEIKYLYNRKKTHIFSLNKFVQADNPDIQLRDCSKEGLSKDSIFKSMHKTSKMRECCDKKTYNQVKLKINSQDFQKRLKITKACKFITPGESIPFKTMMKKLKDTNPMVP
jgi:hypothetical protein